MELGIKNKTALVTGGSKGIGKSIAIALAAEGANVVICARGEEALNEAKHEIEQNGGNVLAIQADLSKQEDVDHLVSAAIDRFHTIDILVNNAKLPVDLMSSNSWKSRIGNVFLILIFLGQCVSQKR
ncbi:SDR family NAD(P)-dependent oxidoreductase [Bacillus sp. V33-4]|uniref:SDR family NAD(P)-dependent oxidoreductase n=1 Tax=Bacillus sp. V33-4 TaxID=2054169 RepID=UPI000C76DACD|nr:SDR family NAD(P)-dependent oxidoreductase [Bacillus sp. V33-4]PLR87182.1 hypothetical protein CVD23_04195 [Bacillus sp. V33-4]